MKIAIILNGASRKKKKFYSSFLQRLQQKFDCTIFETKAVWHASVLAAEMSENFDILISAGGDGTLHEVINGLLQNPLKKIHTLGVIPLGSGNDFATACGLSLDIDQLEEILKKNQPQLTDVGKIFCFDEAGLPIEKYFINACSIGMGPATVSRMKNSPKWQGADLRYLKSILQTFFSHQPELLEVKSTNSEWKGRARVFAVANGKSFGNKIYIAPDANLGDGVFNSFRAAEIPLFKFLLYLQRLKGKKKVKDDEITYATGDWFEIKSSQRVMLEADGELVGYLPARIEILPQKIRVLRK